MMKNTAKHSLVIVTLSFFVAIASVLVPLFAFISGAIKAQSEANDILSIYEKTDYDYILKNPSNDQIDDLKENDSVKNVVGYYQVVYTFKLPENDTELVLKSIDDLKDISITEFSKDRLIAEKEVSGNKIYIDYNLSKKYHLRIGDTIGSNAFQFVIAGFYQNYDTQLAFVPNLKNILSTPISYAGVYVEVKNEADFIANVVQKYKPMATLKARTAFSDDAAYQAYLNSFNNRDFSSYIVDKKVGYTEAKESFANKTAEAKSSYLIAGIVAGTIVLLGLVSLSVLFIKRIKYEVVDGGRKNVILRYTISALVSLFGIVITWLIGASLIINSQLHFVSLSNVFHLGGGSLLIPIASVIVGMVINICVVQGYKEKQK